MKLAQKQKTVIPHIHTLIQFQIWGINSVIYKTRFSNNIIAHEHLMWDIIEMIRMYHTPDFFNPSIANAMVRAEIQNDRTMGR